MKTLSSVVETTFNGRPDRSPYGPCYTGPCPFPGCGGRDRFHVYPYGGDNIPGVGNIGRFHCMDGKQGRAGCGKIGNIIDYVQMRRECSFEEACEEVEIDPQAVRMYRLDQKVKKLESEGATLEEACRQARITVSIVEDYRKDNVIPDSGPRGYYTREKSLAEKSETWRARALELARWASSQLAGEALEYLQSRDLTNRTIKAHLLGFYPTYKRVRAELWGYEYTEDDQKHKRPRKREIWIPRGIVIPWFDDHNQVLCLRFRRLPDDESDDAKLFYGVDERTGEINRYKAMYGSSTQSLYRGELLTSGCSAALFEGEIDALIASQEIDYSCSCVATGSTGWGRSDRSVRRLAACDQVLVCFDADLAGDQAAQYWLNILHNARPWRPLWSDASDMAHDGFSLKDWLTIGLERDDSVEISLSVESPLCYTCNDAGIEREALPDDYEGTMYCAEHHPAHQEALRSETKPSIAQAVGMNRTLNNNVSNIVSPIPSDQPQQAVTPSDQAQSEEMPALSLEKHPVIQEIVKLFNATIHIDPPGYTIQDRARELAEAQKVQQSDHWAEVKAKAERSPVDANNRPYYTPEAWRKKLDNIQNWHPDEKMYAHFPGGYAGYCRMHQQKAEIPLVSESTFVESDAIPIKTAEQIDVSEVWACPRETTIAALCEQYGLQVGEPCENSRCRCPVQRDLYDEWVCCRCYPAKGYDEYANLIDQMYPRQVKWGKRAS